MLNRVHISRVIGPFFLGAVFMYSIQIFYSYPSLEEYVHSRSHPRALDVENYGYGEGHDNRVHRQIGVKQLGKHRELHNTEKMTKKFKRAALGNQSKYKLLLDEVNQLIADADQELVIDPKLDVKEKVKKKRHQPIRPKSKHVDTKVEAVSIEKNKPTFHKDITIPRHEHYVDEPIDAHLYKYIHKPEVCSKPDGRRSKVLLIFLVTTAPKNFERRTLIRKTYANRRSWPALSAGTFRTVFLLGAVDNATLQGAINEESETYRDILQEDFIDSYANLTLKTVMGLKWVTNSCRQAKYTMKIDDDSMIHQNRLLRILKNATAVNFTAAEALIDTPVLRNTSSKYYISEKYYPASTYPPYLNGPGYLISTDLTEGIYKVAVKTPLFPWEDVFLGICMKQLGVTPIVYHDFMLIVDEDRPIRNKTTAAKLFKYFTVVSNLEPEYMELMWTNCRAKIKNSAKRLTIGDSQSKNKTAQARLST